MFNNAECTSRCVDMVAQDGNSRDEVDDGVFCGAFCVVYRWNY